MGAKTPVQEFDQFAHSYDESLDDRLRRIFAAGTQFFHRRKLKLLLKILRKENLNPGNVHWIDIGCGQGDLLKLGSPFFASVAGCDVSSEMLSYCTDLNVHLQTENNRLPFADASADLITAVCLFHHVLPQERLSLALDIKRVLKTGGLFVMIEHNPLNPITQWIVHRSPVDKNARLLATGQSRRLMKDAGLRIEGHEYFLYFPEKIYAYLGGVENGLRRLPLGGQYAVIASKINA